MLAGLGAVGRIGRHGLGGGSGAASASKRPNYSVDLTKGQLGQGMTLARASVGTYYDSAGVLRTAGVNVPRFDYDPVTLAPRGLLLEDASTNLFKDSTTGGTTWAIAAVTNTPPVKTANNVIAPDGTMTGTRLVYPAVSAAGSASNIQQSPTMIAAPYTMSVWLRGDVGGETTYICTTPDGVTYFRQQYVLTTTWQRFVLTTGNLTAAVWFWIIGTDRRDTQQAATPAQTIYTWGSQLEQSDHATSYIATAAATVTRAIDNCIISPANMTSWFDTNAKGTWFAEFDYLDATPVNGARVIGLNTSPNGPAPIQVLSGRNISQYDGMASMNSPTVTAVNEVTRAATTWQPGQAKVCANGGVVATSALLTGSYAFFGLFGIAFMSIGGGNSCEGHLRVLKYWKRILSDTEMQTNTALGDPSLSLDFMTPGVLDSRITFTRASTGTYFDSSGVMRTAAVNAPRWDYDPSTLALNGLLIEDTRSNIIFPSVPETTWAYGNTVMNPNAGIAPDGTNSFVKMTDLATSTFHCITRLTTITASQQYTCSVYLKMGEIRYVQVWIDNGSTVGYGAVFDLQTGVISGAISVGSGATAGLAQMQPCGNGIYRCSVSGIIAANTALRFGIIHMPGPTGTGFPSYLGVVGQGTFIWGIQVEAGTFPTSHIPAPAGVVTRSVEACTIPPANVSPWFASPGGSWFAEFDYFDNAPPNARILGRPNFGGGSNSALTVSAARLIGQYDSSAGVSAANATTSNTITKAASTWTLGLAKVCANGGAVASGTTMVNGYSTYVTNGVAFMVNGFAGSTDNLSGHIRKVQYWPRTLNDGEMQAKTLADVSAPSLVLDFMQPGVLDPRLVMSRPSVATYFDSTGTMRTANNDQTRWDYDPTTGALRGVLIENTRMNGIRNSTMQGAIVGTPGTLPTNWAIGGSPAVAVNVTAIGNENGIPFIEVRLVGTAVSTQVQIMTDQSASMVPALTGQMWASSSYLRLSAGTLAGITGVNYLIHECNSSVAIVKTNPSGIFPTTTNAALNTQRQLYAFTLSGGVTTALLQQRLQFNITNGAAIDATFRIGAPQLEQGPFASSFIPTSSNFVTRAADDMYIPITGTWFSPNNTSLFAEYIYPRAVDALFAHNPVGIGDGAGGANNKFVLCALGVNSNVRSMFSKRAGVAAGVTASGSPLQNFPTKLAASWDASVGMVTANGATPAVGGSQVPLNLIQLVVGDQDRGTGESLDGCIRKIMYWNKTLPAIELQSVTTP